MKMRNKGKVHPFTASSISPSPSSSSSHTDSHSVLKLLPAAILTLLSYLSIEDREVYAYMITRSLKSTNPSFSPATHHKNNTSKPHNSPALFDCDCFHCYTSFWFRWDSSPNRELIHQAIELFEEHLTTGETFKNVKTKRKDKLSRRRTDKLVAAQSPEIHAPEAEVDSMVQPEVDPGIEAVTSEKVAEEDSVTTPPPPAAVVRTHKGLARKVLPDVMGIFSSRLWSLWSPNL